MANHRPDGGHNGALPEANRSTNRSTRSSQEQTPSPPSPCQGNVSDDLRWWRDRNYRDDRGCDDDLQASELVPRRWEGGVVSELGYVEPMEYRSECYAGRHGYSVSPEGYTSPGDALPHPGSGSPTYRRTGPHRGKGPVGYRRSDERIHELVCEALADDDQLDASRIEVSVTDSDVTLSGVVDDYHAKLAAEDCAYSVSGVRDVQNLLSVIGDPATGVSQSRPGRPPSYGRNGREREPLAG